MEDQIKYIYCRTKTQTIQSKQTIDYMYMGTYTVKQEIGAGWVVVTVMAEVGKVDFDEGKVFKRNFGVQAVV